MLREETSSAHLYDGVSEGAMHSILEHVVDQVQLASCGEHLLGAEGRLGALAACTGQGSGRVVGVQDPAQVVAKALQAGAVAQAQHSRVVAQVAVQPGCLGWQLCGRLCMACTHMSGQRSHMEPRDASHEETLTAQPSTL